MGRAPCCDKMGVKKGPWTLDEDQILVSYINNHGHGNWRALPKQAGLLRCGKSCRLRWTNYLRPDIKRGNFSIEEEDNIIKLHQLIGNRWSTIASYLPGRTDNEIKNVWNTHLKKRLARMKAESVTADALPAPTSSSLDSSTAEMADQSSSPLSSQMFCNSNASAAPSTLEICDPVYVLPDLSEDDELEYQPLSGDLQNFLGDNFEDPTGVPAISHDDKASMDLTSSSQGISDESLNNSMILRLDSPMQQFYGAEFDWFLDHSDNLSTAMDSAHLATNTNQVWSTDFQAGEDMDYWLNILRQVDPLPLSQFVPPSQISSPSFTAIDH